MDSLIAGVDNTQKHAEASPVRVVVSFEGDTGKQPLAERMFLDNIRLPPPAAAYATLRYIWENRAPRDTLIPNPPTSRIRMIVAESGREKVGLWQEGTRTVYEDSMRGFGEEAARSSRSAS